MTRKEAINKAAVQFATHFIDTGETDFYGHFVKEQGLDDAEHRGFIAGAKWADANPKQGLVDLSQVWHDVDEEPDMRNKHVYILYIDVDNVPRLQLLCDILEYHDYEIRWEEAVERSCIAKWAYIADLLLMGQYC